MKKLLIIFFVLIGYAAQAQTPDDSIRALYTIVEHIPEFPGGDEAMHKYFMRNISCPYIALMCNCCGTVVVKFTIIEDGSITNPTIVSKPKCEGLHKEQDVTTDCAMFPSMLAEQALKVVKQMPKWKPGMQDGKPVKADYSIAIDFNKY